MTTTQRQTSPLTDTQLVLLSAAAQPGTQPQRGDPTVPRPMVARALDL
jgi:hypothetical protein